MNPIIILLLIIILFLLFQQNQKFKSLEKKMDKLANYLASQPDQKRPSSQKKPISTSYSPPPMGYSSAPEKPKPTPIPPVQEEPKIASESPLQEILKAKPTEEKTPPRPVAESISSPKRIPKPSTVKPPKKSFMERNPDLEKFIGENLLSKIGIVIFVIGMGFLVKLGIDNDVISEPMRIGIGVLIGGIMIGLAHKLRKTFKNFSSILIGGALAVLYFTIGLAFHEYGILSQTASFIIMVIITGFAVLLSLAYNEKILAILALIGGFGTPFFLSTGEGNVAVLLSYLLILDIGMLVLVYFKKWDIINKLAYGFSYIIFIGAFFSRYIDHEDSLRLTMILFLSGFYIVFFLMSLVYNIRNKRTFKIAEIILLVSNSGIYFGLGLALLSSYRDGMFNGVFTTFVALLNFVVGMVLYKRKDIDKTLLFLLFGMVLTFISLIAPIQLKGNSITIFWAIEAVLLFWIAKKSNIKALKIPSVLIAILMIFSLLMDWGKNYTYYTNVHTHLTPFFNPVFLTSIVAIAALVILSVLSDASEKLSYKLFEFKWRRIYARMASILVLYGVLLFELNYQFLYYQYAFSFRAITIGIYHFIFLLVLLVLINKKSKTGYLQPVLAMLSILAVFSYMTFFQIQTFIARTNISSQESGFYWHFLLLILLLSILIYSIYYVKQKYGFISNVGRKTLAVLSFVGVFIISAEVSHFSYLYQLSSDVSSAQAFKVASKSVFPVVWTLCALILMIVGMKFRLKILRLASLILFLLTILKLFIYDLAGNSTGKIISFIVLGAILLLISFLYQKLKFIIEDDKNED